jgi:hypothetical protein
MFWRLVSPILLMAPAFGGQITYGATAPLGMSSVDLPQFDRALGRLESVYLSASVTVQFTVSVENTTAQPLIGDGIQPCSGWFDLGGATLDVGGAGQFFSGGTGDLPLCVPLLDSFDGTIDYAGPSGTVMTFWGSNSGSNEPPPMGGPPSQHYGVSFNWVLDRFSGYGTTSVGVTSYPSYSTFQMPSATYTVVTTGSVSVNVTYNFVDYPSSFCHPTSQAECPCASGPGWGACPNSHSQDGAILAFIGHSSLSADDFGLIASEMGPSATCMFFQGSSSTFSGVVFGDGQRCVSGNVRRLGVKTANQGVATYPEVTDLPISIKGQVPAPNSYQTYQVWYRDIAAYCTPSTFNLTSGVATVWTP